MMQIPTRSKPSHASIELVDGFSEGEMDEIRSSAVAHIQRTHLQPTSNKNYRQSIKSRETTRSKWIAQFSIDKAEDSLFEQNPLDVRPAVLSNKPPEREIVVSKPSSRDRRPRNLQDFHENVKRPIASQDTNRLSLRPAPMKFQDSFSAANSSDFEYSPGTAKLPSFKFASPKKATEKASSDKKNHDLQIVAKQASLKYENMSPGFKKKPFLLEDQQ